MTTKPVTPSPDAGEIIKFPDAPPEEMTAYKHIHLHGYAPSLVAHFGDPETTIIISEIAAALIPTEGYEGVRYPDLLIAFNANPAAEDARNGYLIPEQGKPPDFVLEVASGSTGRHDETVKRDDYARMGVPEYWRFDPTGGSHHSTHLAGDRLVDGVYEPIPIHQTGDQHFWGRSEALGLSICWEEGSLRFWDPVSQRYLTTYREERDARIAEQDARIDAEARARQLEEELRRLSGEQSGGASAVDDP